MKISLENGSPLFDMWLVYGLTVVNWFFGTRLGFMYLLLSFCSVVLVELCNAIVLFLCFIFDHPLTTLYLCLQSYSATLVASLDSMED